MSRERFESFMRSRGYDSLMRADDGHYLNDTAESHWRTWRAAAPTPPSAEPPNERVAQSIPALQAFFSKHALGSMLPPSCFCCGQSMLDREVGVSHAELPDMVICKTCRDAGQAASRPSAKSPQSEREKFETWLLTVDNEDFQPHSAWLAWQERAAQHPSPPSSAKEATALLSRLLAETFNQAKALCHGDTFAETRHATEAGKLERELVALLRRGEAVPPPADALREALTELVALKYMKDKMEGKPGAFDEAYARDVKAQYAFRKDYDRRKPLAWAAARAALLAAPSAGSAGQAVDKSVYEMVRELERARDLDDNETRSMRLQRAIDDLISCVVWDAPPAQLVDQQARRLALEEAAKVCDMKFAAPGYGWQHKTAAEMLAKHIRSLAHPETPNKEVDNGV